MDMKAPLNHFKTLIRTTKLLGCNTLLVTNAAGSLNPDVAPGNLIVIKDHITFQFNNPLVGPNDDDFGPRFVGMEDAYNPACAQQLSQAGKEIGLSLNEGVYFGVLGPSFETPAEIRAFRQLGGDVVGMSTIADVIIARHCGMEVAAVSAVSNMAAGLSDEKNFT